MMKKREEYIFLDTVYLHFVTRAGHIEEPGQSISFVEYRAGIFKKSMGAMHRGGIGFSYRPARLHRLAEFIPWNQCWGPINI
jgi:hypothetical protein